MAAVGLQISENEILQGIFEAIRLILSLDPQVVEITIRSLYVSLTATVCASLVALPVGAMIYFHEFRGKRAVISTLQTLYALPTVLVGLLIFLLLSQSGPLGFFDLLFTPGGMIIAQTTLIIPMLTGLTVGALSGIEREMRYTIVSLGATTVQSIITLLQEARFAIFTAILLAFGRAIAEVGTVMLVGGNIRGYTRVLTTAIALNTSTGNFTVSIALGIILLGVALVVNIGLNLVQQQ
jgi:tungstate transport system permease protein